MGRRENAELLRLLERAGENAVAGAKVLFELFERHPEGDDLVQQIADREHDGDLLTHDIMVRLARRRGRKPFDAMSGHLLATEIDDIIDHAEHTAELLTLYGVEAPMEQAEALAGVLVAAATVVHEALRALGRSDGYASELVEIHRLENEGDRLYREALGVLFAKGIDPMVVIRWKDIFASLEDAVDACESVAHRLEGIALRRRA